MTLVSTRHNIYGLPDMYICKIGNAVESAECSTESFHTHPRVPTAVSNLWWWFSYLARETVLSSKPSSLRSHVETDELASCGPLSSPTINLHTYTQAKLYGSCIFLILWLPFSTNSITLISDFIIPQDPITYLPILLINITWFLHCIASRPYSSSAKTGNNRLFTG